MRKLRTMKIYDPITEYDEAQEAVSWLQASKGFAPYTQEEINQLRVNLSKTTTDPREALPTRGIGFCERSGGG